MSSTPIKRTAFIVEDDKLLTLVEERLLMKLDFEVCGKASSAEEAIEKIEVADPDVILMDISLEGAMDGIEAMEEIRKYSDAPVIYLSGSSDKYYYARARKTGFSDFLIKPVTLEVLSEALQVIHLEEDVLPPRIVQESGIITSS